MTNIRKRLTAIACLFTALLGACTGKGPILDVERTITDHYGADLHVVSLLPAAQRAEYRTVLQLRRLPG